MTTISETNRLDFTQTAWGRALSETGHYEVPANTRVYITEADSEACAKGLEVINSNGNLSQTFTSLFNKAVNPYGKNLDKLTAGDLSLSIDPNQPVYSILSDGPVVIDLRPRDVAIKLSEVYQKMIDAQISNPLRILPKQRLFVLDLDVKWHTEAMALAKEEHDAHFIKAFQSKMPEGPYEAVFVSPEDLYVHPFSGPNNVGGVAFVSTHGIDIGLRKV